MTYPQTTASNTLTARWARTLPNEATVIAGAGVWPLLAILAASANDPAARELSDAAGSTAADGIAAGSDLLHLLSTTPGLRAAIGIWADKDAPLRPEWRDALPPHTCDELRGDGTDQARLDAWASEQTDGLIPTMPVTVDEKTLMVLATAIMVRTTWLRPFTAEPLRYSAAANGAWGGVERANVLERDDDPSILTFAADGSLTMVEVEGDNGISVHLVLGTGDASAADVLATAIDCLGSPELCIGADTLAPESVFPGVTVQRVPSPTPESRLVLTTVPFDVTADHNLLDHAEVFGLKAATDSTRGHFPRISESPLAIQQAKQSARAAFTEKGFEAAAVTAFAFMDGFMAPNNVTRRLDIRVTFDRPFGFVAVHKPTGLVVVAGWVTEPQVDGDAQP